MWVILWGGNKDRKVEDYGISTKEIRRYQAYFRRDTDAIIYLNDLAKQLPSLKTDSMGTSLFWGKITKVIGHWSSEKFYWTTRWGRSSRHKTILCCTDNMSKGSTCDRWWVEWCDCWSSGSLPWDTCWQLYITWGSTVHQIDEVLWLERGKTNVSICKLWLERKQATFCMCKYEELWLQREQVKFCISR